MVYYFRLKKGATQSVDVNMNKSLIKKAVKRAFGHIYKIASITVDIRSDTFHGHYENIVIVIVEKDMCIRKLKFISYWKTCYTYSYIADTVYENELKWMYETLYNCIEDIMIEG